MALKRITDGEQLIEGIYKLIRQHTVGHQRAMQGAKEILDFVRPAIERAAMERVFEKIERVALVYPLSVMGAYSGISVPKKKWKALKSELLGKGDKIKEGE